MEDGLRKMMLEWVPLVLRWLATNERRSTILHPQKIAKALFRVATMMYTNITILRASIALPLMKLEVVNMGKRILALPLLVGTIVHEWKVVNKTMKVAIITIFGTTYSLIVKATIHTTNWAALYDMMVRYKMIIITLIRDDLEVSIHTSKVAIDESSIDSCSEELGAVVIIIDDLFVIVLLTTDSSPRKIIRIEMWLLLSTHWATFFTIDGPTFLVVWTTLLRITRIKHFTKNKTTSEVFSRSFWTTYSWNFKVESLSFEAMIMALVGTNMVTLWIALIYHNNKIVVVLLSHIFGSDTHSIKDALIVDARRTVGDDMRNIFHLIGATYDRGIFITINTISGLLISFVCHDEMISLTSFCNILETTNCMIWIENINDGAIIYRDFAIIAYLYWITWHKVWVAFNREICIVLRANLHYTMVAWMRGLSLSLKEILLPTLSIWEYYILMLCLWKAKHSMLGMEEITFAIMNAKGFGYPCEIGERWHISHKDL